jgi:dihydropteroate synthase-like protein
MSDRTGSSERICFVTGRLAESALRSTVERLAGELGFAYDIAVLPITVAALMSPSWIARQLQLPAGTTRLILPGYCEGEVTPIAERFPGVMIERGPRDLRRLPEHFGKATSRDASYGQYDIEIIAEINHAPRMARDEILALARRYRDHGADLIDVGCIPGEIWSGVGDCVKLLCDEGFRVSIDSLQPKEIAPAAQAGAELVLSVNASNREAALDWGIEVVAIPDDFATLGGLEETVDLLATGGVKLRVDPVLEPIGFGFAESLGRYLRVRRLFPEAEMMMGIGNLTELTDVDSAGVNVLLLGFCQELGIRSMLTTEVINWARSSVAECDLARRLVHYAVTHRVPPKHLEPRLVCLRDAKLLEFGQEHMEQLASQIKDHNYRLFAERGELHLIAAGLHLADADPFLLFERLLHPPPEVGRPPPRNVDPSHAFYLGYEMCKALVALTLGKEYRQDEALDWGHLTRPENRHRLKLSGTQRTENDSP